MKVQWNDVYEFKGLLRQRGIGYAQLTDQEMKAYKREWFKRFVPEDKRKEAIDSYCFDKDGACGYLWHVFSYEIIACRANDEARKSFDEVNKQETVLLVNIEDVAYRIKDASKLHAEDFEGLYDMILTDQNFSWTYVKTHEIDCGPYFYSV